MLSGYRTSMENQVTLSILLCTKVPRCLAASLPVPAKSQAQNHDAALAPVFHDAHHQLCANPPPDTPTERSTLPQSPVPTGHKSLTKKNTSMFTGRGGRTDRGML